MTFIAKMETKIWNVCSYTDFEKWLEIGISHHKWSCQTCIEYSQCHNTCIYNCKLKSSHSWLPQWRRTRELHGAGTQVLLERKQTAIANKPICDNIYQAIYNGQTVLLAPAQLILISDMIDLFREATSLADARNLCFYDIACVNEKSWSFCIKVFQFSYFVINHTSIFIRILLLKIILQYKWSIVGKYMYTLYNHSVNMVKINHVNVFRSGPKFTVSDSRLSKISFLS